MNFPLLIQASIGIENADFGPIMSFMPLDVQPQIMYPFIFETFADKFSSVKLPFLIPTSMGVM